jgi:hypothetical protein
MSDSALHERAAIFAVANGVSAEKRHERRWHD